MNRFPYSCFHFFLVNITIELDVELGEPFPRSLFLESSQRDTIQAPVHSVSPAPRSAPHSPGC